MRYQNSLFNYMNGIVKVIVIENRRIKKKQKYRVVCLYHIRLTNVYMREWKDTKKTNSNFILICC